MDTEFYLMVFGVELVSISMLWLFYSLTKTLPKDSLFHRMKPFAWAASLSTVSATIFFAASITPETTGQVLIGGLLTSLALILSTCVHREQRRKLAGYSAVVGAALVSLMNSVSKIIRIGGNNSQTSEVMFERPKLDHDEMYRQATDWYRKD